MSQRKLIQKKYSCESTVNKVFTDLQLAEVHRLLQASPLILKHRPDTGWRWDGEIASKS